MTAPLVLPQACPLCGTLLQQHWPDPRAGVAPHFTACHRGTPIPPATTEEVATG